MDLFNKLITAVVLGGFITVAGVANAQDDAGSGR